MSVGDGLAWSPLLEGAEATRALDVVDEIADQLGERLRAGGTLEMPLRADSSFSLAGGKSGIALLFAYLDLAQPGKGHDETALELLDAAVGGVGEALVSEGLYSGFSGVAWAIEHLRSQLGTDAGDEDPAGEIAAILVDHLGQTPWQRHYDLISGLTGLAVYALERLPRPGGREALERIVARLGELAEPAGPGITWRTPPAWLSPQELEVFPEGNFNLGVSHGVPGTIGVLAGAAAAGLSEASSLLERALAWVLAQKLPPSSDAVFPASVSERHTPERTRLAWCYGDVGVSATLLATARATNLPDLEQEALAAARRAASRSDADSGVIDAGLCHGAAGVAHLFNRVYQATDDPLLRDAARHWISRTLNDFRRPGEGLAGYLAWIPDETRALSWQPDPGFLTGAAGVALTLLAATTSIPPAWDHVLLASLPPPPQ